MRRRHALLLTATLVACVDRGSDDTAGGEVLCTPGMSSPCACTSGDAGAQVCADDGLSYGPCVCDPPTTTGETGPTTGAADSSEGPGSSSGTTTTGTTGDATTTVDSTTSGTTMMNGSTTEAVCIDPGPEPNEDEHDLDLPWPPVGCDSPSGQLTGVLDGATDIDWHLFLGSFSQGRCAKPWLMLSADADVRMCAFFACDNLPDSIDVACTDGAEPGVSPENRPGCCAKGDFGAVIACGAEPQAAAVWVRLDQAPPDACVEYSVEYELLPP